MGGFPAVIGGRQSRIGIVGWLLLLLCLLFVLLFADLRLDRVEGWEGLIILGLRLGLLVFGGDYIECPVSELDKAFGKGGKKRKKKNINGKNILDGKSAKTLLVL